ncbi:unnamed protein product [Prunus armeniaca]
MSQGDMTRHEGAGGTTKLSCRKAMWLGTWVLKTSLALVDGWVPKAQLMPNDGWVPKASLKPYDEDCMGAERH